ncbi:MAG: hypothetical protein RQ745_11055 [Longimicrobiales bacterium]|nr:hypothetical protein [Longimicrobiales bacterium]
MLNDPMPELTLRHTGCHPRMWRRDRHRPPWATLPTLIAASLLLAACGEGRPSGDADTIVRDSAGIEIVESGAPAWGSEASWRISPEPVLEIGATTGPEAYLLDRVVGAVRLSDGRIVIGDGGSRQLRYYDTDGRHIVDAGGQGGGPGEFGILSRIVRMPGDSVGGWESNAKRLSIFDADGNFGRSVTFDVAGQFFAPLHGVFADGSVVISPGQDMLALRTLEPGEYRRTKVYLRFAGDGTFLDTLTTAPGPEAVFYREGTSSGNRDVFFGRDHHIAFAGEHFYEGDSGAFVLTASAPDGAPLRLIRRAFEPRAVTPDELESEVRRTTESRARSLSSLAEQTGRDLSGFSQPDDVTHRETYPAFDGLLVDTEGNLWVEAYPVPGTETREWSVFDPDGRWLGEIRTPEGVEIYQIGSDYLLGRWLDDFEVHYVRVYRLTKP